MAMEWKFKILSAARRAHVRRIAREAWIASEFDRRRAYSVAEFEIHRSFSGFWASFLVTLAVQLAMKLIDYWLEKNEVVPLVAPRRGEPDYLK